MNKTSIEWTDFTWNPIRARNKETGKVGTFCTHASPGCLNCYAEAIGKRFGTGLAFNVPNLDKIEFFVDEEILEEPLRRKKPARIFVGDMFDLFHEAIPFSLIARVFKVACDAFWHTYQFLTKRAQRMFEFFAAWSTMTRDWGPLWPHVWPKRHIWLGVSVESQQYADERIPLLLQTPAAVRFLSVEPMLEKVTLTCVGSAAEHHDVLKPCHWERGISWVICGGESGPGARPFNLVWAESLLEQCRAAGVPFFMKQVGSVPIMLEERWLRHNNPLTTKTPIRDSLWLSANKRHDAPANHVVIGLRDSKGGNPAEWPEHLRVREFPAERTVSA